MLHRRIILIAVALTCLFGLTQFNEINYAKKIVSGNPLLFMPARHGPRQDDSWRAKAAVMVEQQIIARGIKDSLVLAIMRKTPRHLFVPSLYRNNAYEDRPLPIGKGQTISQPYIVALMTELLQLKSSDTVLEIGTGSGYQSAILAQLAQRIYSVELVKFHADSAAARLRQLGYSNVSVKCSDGYKGWKEHAPYDKIIVTAAPPVLPEELLKQLKPGGKMVLPVGDLQNQFLLVVTKTDKNFALERKIPVSFVPMVHKAGQVHGRR